MHEFHSIAVETSLRGIYRGSMLFLGADVLRLIIFTIFLGNAHCLSIQENHEVEVRKASGYVGARLSEQGVFSNSDMSLERPEIGDAKRVDPLLTAASVVGGGWLLVALFRCRWGYGRGAAVRLWAKLQLAELCPLTTP